MKSKKCFTLLTIYLAGLNNLTAPYGGNQKTKGNNMLDRHSMTYSQLNTVEKAELEKQENRAGWVGAAILIIMYCAASTMEYNDCINLGVC